MKLLKCAMYLVLTGIISFFSGRMIPKRRLKPEKGWFRSFAFEKGGAVYEKLGIRKWQNRVPDMSRILPFMMPAKNLSGNYKERLPEMIQETCVAEIVHLASCILGLPCLWMWPGAGGVIITVIFIGLLNLPFIFIQRYNRPRLLRLQKKLQAREEKKEGVLCEY